MTPSCGQGFKYEVFKSCSNLQSATSQQGKAKMHFNAFSSPMVYIDTTVQRYHEFKRYGCLCVQARSGPKKRPPISVPDVQLNITSAAMPFLLFQGFQSTYRRFKNVCLLQRSSRFRANFEASKSISSGFVYTMIQT
jgi:hypothetical protein